ncbi:jg7039 [Pararge aegeria aegeria]|uniref:Jg7039 protein n=1 Tax=Pararge aegeria aegeria TaxID=348720 RepID=A0A8S4RIF5_9NEOP|nr:jg7039 [Pararge aegeria aegeria]
MEYCSHLWGGSAKKECINSLASDDHTGMDSFHECLQEYGEGLEVVQICLEPEESSIKDEELSALADLSYDDCEKNKSVIEDKNIMTIEMKNEVEKINGITDLKLSKSDNSIDDQDDDMTITEDDVLIAPRELSMRSKSVDRKGTQDERCLSKQQSKDLSTSDEMVFAVTPTGLERISFEKYWKECDMSKDKIQNNETLISPEDDISFYDATTRISVQEQNNSLLYIDHEIDGYETCLDDDSSSVKCTEKNGHKINGESDEIKDFGKHDKIAIRNKDNDVRAKTINDQNTANAVDEVSSYGFPYVEEHIIKQMKSLRIEPLNINIGPKKSKKKSPIKPSKSERRCIEYYNDQAECLKEIRRKRLEEEESKSKEAKKRILEGSLSAMEKKMHFKKQDPSEESTDAESNYIPGCHKCFLESYAYEITKAFIEKAASCKYCDVIRDMLEVPNIKPSRRRSAPALVNLESPSDTEDEELLGVPSASRRKSAGPLKFLLPSRRSR